MSHSVCCRVCLSSDNKMYDIRNIELQEIYEKVTSAKLYSDGKPTTICFICCAQLVRYHQFSVMSRKSDELLTNLVNNGMEVTKETVYKLNQGLFKSLSLTATQCNEYTPDNVLENIIQVNDETATDDSETGNLVINEDYEAQIVTDNITMNAKPTHSFCCDVCNKIMLSKAALTRHLRVHTGEKPYVCPTCNKAFSFDSSCKRHVRNHCGEIPYPCDKCDDKFYTSSDLQSHQRIHIISEDNTSTSIQDNNKFACSQCNRTFSRKTNLKLHFRTHTGENLFTCDECGKKFTRISFLKNHMLNHSALKLYTCHLCDSAFATSWTLKSHIRMHSGEKPWACSICNRKFTVKASLTNHMQVHSGRKPYACDSCSRTFFTRFHLKVHMNVHARERYFIHSQT